MWSIFHYGCHFQPYGPLLAQRALLYSDLFHVTFCVYVLLCAYVYVVNALQSEVFQGVGVCILHSLGLSVSVQWCFPVGTFPGCPAHESLLILGPSVPATAKPLWCDRQLIAFPPAPNSAHFPLHQSEGSFDPPEVQGSHRSGPGQEPREPEGLALHVTNLCGKPYGPTQKTATRGRNVPYLLPAPSTLSQRITENREKIKQWD